MFNVGISILVAYIQAHFYITRKHVLWVMVGTSDFILLQSILSISGADMVPCVTGTTASVPRGEVARIRNWPHTNAEAKNVWRYNSTTPYTLLSWCLTKSRDVYTLLIHGASNQKKPWICNWYPTHHVCEIGGSQSNCWTAESSRTWCCVNG
jgi:hypothetical protein